MYAENESSVKKNEAALIYLPGEIYTIKANSKFPYSCKHPVTAIQAAQNQKQTNTGG